MTARPLPIKLTSNGRGTGTIHVDGQDVSRLVTSARIDVAAGEVAEATLDLVSTAVAVDLDRAVVNLEAGTHDFLVRLGWTPPGGDR